MRVHIVQGFLIEVVEPGSPAEKAGLQGGQLELTLAGRDFLIGGDVITKVNDTALTSPDKLLEALNRLHVGSNLRLQIFRQGKYLDVSYVLPGDRSCRETRLIVCHWLRGILGSKFVSLFCDCD